MPSGGDAQQAQANMLDTIKKDAVNSSEFGPRSLEVAYFLLYVAMALVAIAFFSFCWCLALGGR